jgi:tRNA pseudouridine38-40 synthase
VQPGQSTVQAALEAALAQLLGHPVRATAAGRTDAGVHADAQVISVASASSIPAEGIARALQRYLPADIWIVDAADVPLSFDARRSAERRWYRYHVWRGAVPPVAWQGRCLAHVGALDLPAMREAARHLLGRRDFRGVSSPPAARSSIRTVFAADWLDQPPLATFEICADGFLMHMVRGIVGGLLWVGHGRWTAEQFATALITTDRRNAGPNAPPIGLTLSRIEY